MNRIIALTTVIVLLTFALLSNQFSNAQSETPMPPPAMTATAIAPSPTPSPTPSADVQNAVIYISQRENIPITDLLVVNTFEAEYELLGRAFQFVSVMNTLKVEENTYDVLVDLESGEIVDDPEVIRTAGEEAYLERYGKLHPLLYQRLQEVDDETQLPVTFWIAPNPAGRSQEEIIAILADRYSQVDEAMEKWGYPWAVSDSELRDQIEADFRQLLTEDVAVRALPLITELQMFGVDVRTYDALPSVSAILSKRNIELLVQRADVSIVYLTEPDISVEMDSAPWSNRAPNVWNTGFSGSTCEGDGCQIAILEPGRIDTLLLALTLQLCKTRQR